MSMFVFPQSAAGRRGAGKSLFGLTLALAGLGLASESIAQQTGRPVVVRNAPQDAAAGTNVLQPQAALNPPAAVPLEPAANTLLAELKGLVEKRAVVELRTTYNGQYGASLLFKAEDLTYYVAMFQQRQFWRAARFKDYAQAEKLYRTFVGQTETLAEVDIQRIRLDAERIHTEQQIQADSAELAALRSNLEFQRQREREVLLSQTQAREQAKVLAEQERAARARLQALQESIRSLEAQQAELLK